MRISIATLCLIIVSASGCAGWEGPRPEGVPTQTAIAPQATSVLQVTFKADASGVTVVDLRQVTGAPTLAIDQDRDVLITALDAQGNVAGSVSVFNPRLVRTAGSRDPASAVLDEATFTVSFPDPDRIATVDLKVVRGPNEDFQERFSVAQYRK